MDKANLKLFSNTFGHLGKIKIAAENLDRKCGQIKSELANC